MESTSSVQGGCQHCGVLTHSKSHKCKGKRRTAQSKLQPRRLGKQRTGQHSVWRDPSIFTSTIVAKTTRPAVNCRPSRMHKILKQKNEDRASCCLSEAVHYEVVSRQSKNSSKRCRFGTAASHELGVKCECESKLQRREHATPNRSAHGGASLLRYQIAIRACASLQNGSLSEAACRFRIAGETLNPPAAACTTLCERPRRYIPVCLLNG